jgi:D-2-hydroxyacid dehydrogenase (NADP+)
MSSGKTNSRRIFLQKMARNGAIISGAPLLAPTLLQGQPREVEAKNLLENRLPLKIWLSAGLSDEIEKEIKAISPLIEICKTSTEDEKKKILPEIQACWGSITEPDLKQAKKLKWVHTPSAGVENYLYPEMMQRHDIEISNAKGCYAPAIAEHTIGMLFALTRGIKEQALNMPQHHWKGVKKQVEMRNMTMGIIGFGGIGREIARRAKALDLKILAADIRPLYSETSGNIADELYDVNFGGFEKVLENSNVIVCAVPHTPVSEGMFDEKAFQKMPQGAYFINVSRGKLVKTEDLVKVLANGHIAGAALDVTDPEPLPSDHKLWDLKNVLITAHISGVSQYSRKRSEQVFASNVQRYVKGLPLLNQVDKEAGF